LLVQLLWFGFGGGWLVRGVGGGFVTFCWSRWWFGSRGGVAFALESCLVLGLVRGLCHQRFFKSHHSVISLFFMARLSSARTKFQLISIVLPSLLPYL